MEAKPDTNSEFAHANAKVFAALTIFGFALIGTWSNILGYSPVLIDSEAGGGSATSTWFSAGRLAAAVVFIVFAVAMQKRIRPLGVLAGTALAPLSLIMCLAVRQSGIAVPLLDAGFLLPLCAFIGSIGFLVISVPLSVRLINALGSRRAALCTIAGILGECILSSLVNACGSFELQLAVCTLAPFAGGLCLHAVESIDPAIPTEDNDGEITAAGSSRIEMHGTQDAFGTVLMLAQLSLVMMLASLLRSMSGMGPWGQLREGYLGTSSFDIGSLAFICLFVGSASLVIFVLLDRFPSQCRCALAIVIVLCGMQMSLLNPGAKAEALSNAATMTIACQIFSRVIIKVTFMECVRQLQIPPLRINGIAALFNVTGSMLFASATTFGMSASDLASNVVYILLSVTIVAVTLPYMDKTGLRGSTDAVGFDPGNDAKRASARRSPADGQPPSPEAPRMADPDGNSVAYNDDAVRAFAASRGLSAREEEVFALLLDGCTRGQVERLLGLSEGTVRTHVNAVYRKVDVHSKSDMQQAFSDWARKRAEACTPD